ncbi:TetR/AcrR family transcriptional regulator [Nocardiopsis sp. MG754419]|uniref:TetR/AcrR family transcriptional regulator n=1 Tax=Nocardiopsis sp. MG754419 TaxID=2259865 RepID=UPI001BA79F8B|nr:helix-turn-helix domain-containing protein [Nocardiopsis sp. MG754419]MBR8743949.1 TetR/AcrR family transcriptional regulator [Nocardiopsis sp. MG754419]
MRADKARNREAILAAAGRLFDEADDPDRVSMDAVATAAGVGKGTIFRGFGDRDGLLRALYDQYTAREFQTLPDAVPDLLVRIWDFKRRHRVLTLALEREGFASPYRNDGYDRLHRHLVDLVTRARGPRNADFLAHALLAAVRSDLVEYLKEGSEADPREGLRELARSLLGPEPGAEAAR